MSSSHYKLTYYDLPGRAEPIRLLFAMAQVPFEDVRIKMADWPTWKPKMPWGQIPVLEVDGRPIAQTGTIMRFLARRFKLIGSNEFEEARCEELVDASVDFAMEMKKFRMEKDDSKKESLKQNLIGNLIPKFYGRLDSIQAKNGDGSNFLVGASVTWADVWAFTMFERVEENFPGHDFLKLCPNLAKVKVSILAFPQVKDYIAKRPKP